MRPAHRKRATHVEVSFRGDERTINEQHPLGLLREAFKRVGPLTPADALLKSIIEEPDDRVAMAELSAVLSGVMYGPRARNYALGMNVIREFAEQHEAALRETFAAPLPRNSSGRMSRRSFAGAAAKSLMVPLAFSSMRLRGDPGADTELPARTLAYVASLFALIGMTAMEGVEGVRQVFWADMAHRINEKLAEEVGMPIPPGNTGFERGRPR